MALIKFDFGREPTDDDSDERTGDTDDTAPERVEIPIDDADADESASDSTSDGRGLRRAILVLALVAAAVYLLSRRTSSPEDVEFAEIVFEDETAEAETESPDE